MHESNGAYTFGEFEDPQKPWLYFDRDWMLERLMQNEVRVHLKLTFLNMSLLETSPFIKQVVNFDWPKI